MTADCTHLDVDVEKYAAFLQEASTLPQAQIDAMLRRCGYPAFDGGLVSSTYGVQKRSGKLFRQFLHETELDARRVLFIGDSWRADVAGAALATVAAQFLSAGICLWALWRQNTPFAFASVRPCFARDDAVLILRFGLPTALQSCMITLGGMTVQGIVNSFGSVTMAAYTAVQRIDSLTIQVIVAVSNALAIYTGQNMGHRDLDRVRLGLRATLKALCASCLVLAVAVFAARRWLLSIFLDPATDAASIAQGADFLSVMVFAYIIAAVMNSYLNVLRGAGDVNVSLIAGLFEMGARLLFAGLLAPRLGVWGIWLATPLSWAAGCIIPVARYHSGEWMKKALL